MSVRKKLLLFSIGAFAAIGAVAYMLFADIWNQYVSNKLISKYTEITSSYEDYADEYTAAVSYNENLLYGTNSEEEYEDILDVSGNGMMGYITIPKINVCLPVYHYTTDEVLLKGAGHMYGSSLPVGGENTHCIISAHRGLPSSTLFSNLDQMEEGDVIYLSVLGNLLAYKVYDVETVLPEEVDGLGISIGEDLLTLVTCTPYGVNTHRLLVHARRIELSEEETEAAIKEASPALKIDMSLVIMLAFEVIVYVAGIVLIKRQDKKAPDDSLDFDVSESEWGDDELDESFWEI